jgi:hypothetical protein
MDTIADMENTAPTPKVASSGGWEAVGGRGRGGGGVRKQILNEKANF